MRNEDGKSYQRERVCHLEDSARLDSEVIVYYYWYALDAWLAPAVRYGSGEV